MHTTILTDLVHQFLQATSSWYQALIPIAKSLFVTLAAIQLAWTAANVARWIVVIVGQILSDELHGKR